MNRSAGNSSFGGVFLMAHQVTLGTSRSILDPHLHAVHKVIWQNRHVWPYLKNIAIL